MCHPIHLIQRVNRCSINMENTNHGFDLISMSVCVCVFAASPLVKFNMILGLFEIRYIRVRVYMRIFNSMVRCVLYFDTHTHTQTAPL